VAALPAGWLEKIGTVTPSAARPVPRAAARPGPAGVTAMAPGSLPAGLAGRPGFAPATRSAAGGA
jgi:hypothetical protein